MAWQKTLVVVTAFFALGCAGGDAGQKPVKGSPDATYVFENDAGPDMFVAEDMPADADGRPDFGVAGILEVVEDRGSGGVILRGLVLTSTGAQIGEVFFEGPTIKCVSGSCSDEPGAETATVVETNGIISPGLIDAHNHLPYNFLPEWDSQGRFFENRYEWADDPSYEAHVEPYAANRASGTHYCPAAKWGEFRSLMNGTTTIMGQSFNQNCIDGWTRNADHEHRLQWDHMRTTIASPRDITTEDAQNYIDSFDAMVEPVTRFAVHMAEGVSGNNIELEFDSFAGRDERPNRHAGQTLLYKETAILIHSIALTPTELDEVASTNSKVVWSPSSNFALYGETADIAGILERDITVGLGPDWTISGEDNMLAEMRFANEYVTQAGIESTVTPRHVWEMATSSGAEVVGLSDYVGTLEEGKRADISVFANLSSDPYEAVSLNTAATVRLVVLNGEVFYGDVAARGALARNAGCEAVTVCGIEKFFCARDNDIDEGRRSLAQVEQELVDILEGNGYPEDEQYGRGEDLLPLWSCE